jgi:uncharacterized membrane protein YdjX (TVP38/TMEM64 family)
MSRRSRTALVLLACAAVLVGARVLGFDQALGVASVRASVERAGVLGPLAFSALFVAATLLQIPGIPLLMLAPALFGTGAALALCVPLSHLAVLANFELVRRIGGRGVAPPKASWITRLLLQLDAHPVRTVALVRAITVMFPPVTTALALTRLGRRDHFLGTLIGMTPPVAVLVWLSGAVLPR